MKFHKGIPLIYKVIPILERKPNFSNGEAYYGLNENEIMYLVDSDEDIEDLKILYWLEKPHIPTKKEIILVISASIVGAILGILI